MAPRAPASERRARHEPRAARRLLRLRLVPHDLACKSPSGGVGGADRGDRWLAVWSIALGSLALVFSEVVPIGLLPDISHHLGVSIGTGGLMVVVPAVTAAIAAPSLTVGSAWFERRRLLVGLSVLVLVSDAVAASAPSFAVLLGARVLLGACIGGFWAFGTGAAMSLVGAPVRGTAVAIVSGGIFVATVAALPVASLIGNVASWRVGFVVAGALAASGIAFQLAALPHLGRGEAIRPRALLAIFRVRAARIGLSAAAAIFFAHFAAYTYLAPLLHERARVARRTDHDRSSWLRTRGSSNELPGRRDRSSPPEGHIAGECLDDLCGHLLMALINDAAPATIVLTLAWGAGFGAVPVATQTWTAQTMPTNIDGGLALFTSALQGSLAAGSAVGGVLYNAHGASAPLILAAVVAAGASLAVIRPVAGVDAPAPAT